MKIRTAEFTAITQEELPVVITSILEVIRPAMVITLTGPLGAGKTTLVTQLCTALGVQESVNSPTFTYVNVYHTRDNLKIYHFDLYRIGSLSDFVELGFAEWLYQVDSLCIIEWPEIITPILKPPLCQITIDYDKNPETRNIKIEFVQ